MTTQSHRHAFVNCKRLRSYRCKQGNLAPFQLVLPTLCMLDDALQKAGHQDAALCLFLLPSWDMKRRREGPKTGLGW
jgi:hypothetical protein